jgi:S-adenosylmethionine:tRNA ribosyltransferase-isomerase
MHAEWYELPEDTARAVARCRRRRCRVIAVGTTSLRVLETCAGDNGLVRSGTGWTELFCYPPYDFRVVDALLTNFHLPRSTLLALVMAFAGVDRMRRAYRHAVEARYRFYSYGDAMFIA